MNVYLGNCENFNNNGLGFLKDCLSANVTHEKNGTYELNFEYPLNTNMIDYLVEDNIVKCNVGNDNYQLFRIKHIQKTFKTIKVNAPHIFYDLSANFIEDCAPTNLTADLFGNWILDRTTITNKFKFSTNITDRKSARYVRRNPVECIMGSIDNSILSLFNAEIIRDNFDINILDKIGNDNNVKLSIGKNIKEINISIDSSCIFTKVMPVGYDGLLLPEKYVNSPLIDNYIFPKICKYNFDNIKYDETADDAYHTLDEAYEALRNATNELYEKGLDKPTINVKINWLELSKTKEYYDKYHYLEKVELGDTVHADLLGLTYTARITKTIYNVLTDKIDSFEVGSTKNTINTTLNLVRDELVKSNPNDILIKAKKDATNLITSAMGGFVYKTQNELFIMDTNNLNTAQKVWRWNLNGLGYSKNGIKGPFETAITQDGAIVADFITTGTIATQRIEGYGQLILDVKDVSNTVQIQNNKISQITQTVDELNSKIGDIADITITGESNFATVDLDNINQSEPITIKIRPVVENISYLYPRENLFPSDKLFFKYRTLRFTNKTTGKIFDYELPADLLYYDSENYDEFILEYDSHTVFVNKKVEYNADGTTYLLEKPTTAEYEFPKIELTDGDYTVSLPGYDNAYIFVRLMVQNIYTTQFATRAEVNSEISQTATEINLEVSKKIGKDEVISKINQSSEVVTIQANKVNINGVISAINNNTTTTINGDKIKTGSITANQIAANTISADKVASDIITTNNFSAQEINADSITSGTINGNNVTVTNLSASNITGGTLSADKINGGTISASAINLGSGTFTVNTSGTIRATSGSIGGFSLDGTSGLTSSYGTIRPNGNLLLYPNSGSARYVLSSAMTFNAQSGIVIASNSNANISAPSNNLDLKACSGGTAYLACMGYSDGSDERSAVSCADGVLNLRSDGTIYANGAAIGGSSSKNTKTNIEELSQEKKNELYGIIKDIPIYEYDYKPQYGKETNYGFLIEDIEDTELEKLLHIVKVNENIKTYCSEDLTRLNLIMIKELIKKVETLENKIKEMESDK